MDHLRHVALAGLIGLGAIVIGCTTPTGGGASGAPASAAPPASVAPAAGGSVAPGASSAPEPTEDDEYTAP